MRKMFEFHHGALADTYEEQANKQGYTYGDKAKWVEAVGYGIVCAYIHGCITESEYDRILDRFQKKILLKNLKPMEEQDEAKMHNR